MICSTSARLDQFCLCCCCNLVSNDYIHASQKEEKIPKDQAAEQYSHLLTLRHQSVQQPIQRNHCCYCWIPRLLKAYTECAWHTYTAYVEFHLNVNICCCIVLSFSRSKGCQTKEPQDFFIPSCSAQTRLLCHLVPLSKWIILVMVKGNKTKDQQFSATHYR